MKVFIVKEYNKNGYLLYFDNFPGAYTRGKTLEEALLKIPFELESYCRWANIPFDGKTETKIVQEKLSDLHICDADSEVLFDSEKGALSMEDYKLLKHYALKSAQDFLKLYLSVPDKDATVLAQRKTFYGQVSVTANEMYEHTKNVNEYYFAEIGVIANNEPDIYVCRLNGFVELEKQTDFLLNAVIDGSYGEQWSLKKMLRRFIWHDRIHAKAMWRMATKLCGKIENPFYF